MGTGIELTVAGSSGGASDEATAYSLDVLPRFVQATQILMLGAERRQKAEAEQAATRRRLRLRYLATLLDTIDTDSKENKRQ